MIQKFFFMFCNSKIVKFVVVIIIVIINIITDYYYLFYTTTVIVVVIDIGKIWGRASKYSVSCLQVDGMWYLPVFEHMCSSQQPKYPSHERRLGRQAVR